MRLLLALVLGLLLAPAAASAQVVEPLPPAATTGAARAVEPTTATVTGTVDPNGSATTYRFEYGPTTTYGQQTAEKSAGSGDGNGAAEAGLEGLTPDTTYHYRIVATSAAGTAMGADTTLRTQRTPRRPGVARTGAAQIGAQSVVLRATIDPNDGETRYRFEYGSTAAFGSRTSERRLPESDGGVAITESLGRLRPYRRYFYRLVATNAAGTTTSTTRTFTTARLPTAITLSVDRPTTPWGEGIEVFGRVSGTGAAGIPVGLERQDFPYAGPFSTIGAPPPVRADRFGRFRVFIPTLFSATHFRALTRTSVSVVSPVVTAQVTVKVGAAVLRVSRKRVRIRGAVLPSVPNGRAVLQRRTSAGGWSFIAGRPLRQLTSTRSRYTFPVRRRKVTREYRVRVIARDGGEHFPGTSRTVAVRPPTKRR